MAKKVRFPLEMEDGIEVRSVEELRKNFSLPRVLGYIQDGKMITWLRDRYENDLADAIEMINPEEREAAKKICEVFDIIYNEDPEEAVEQAEERKRKMEILKQYPECMEYSKQIDSIAFDQDDLYDLLDEDAEVIYLCGDKFSIPLSKTNTKYVGILEGVVAIIDSKQPVDFESKSIQFENCRFDDKYSSLIVASADSDDDDGIDADEEENEERGLLVDAEELQEFITDLRETISDFLEEEYENDEDELYSYEAYFIDCDADDYNEDGFETKTEAKSACKDALEQIMDELKEQYDDAKSELINMAEIYYEGMVDSLVRFMSVDFWEAYENYVDIYCTGDTKDYLEEQMREYKETNIPSIGWEAEIRNKCNEAIKQIKHSHFDAVEKANISLKKFFGMCEYEKDDDEYSFDLSEACENMADEYIDIIRTEEEIFPESVQGAYEEIKEEYVTKLAEWIDVLGDLEEE